MRPILLALLLGPVACGGARPATSRLRNTAPAHAELSGFVLVPRGVVLRDQPGERGQHARPYDLAPGAPENLGEDWVMRAIGEEGEYVEIENVRPVDLDPHCYRAIGGLDALHLHMWVRADELRAATTHEVRVDYPDGTSITLGGGVAVARTGAADGAGRPIVSVGVDGLALTAALPPDTIGATYQPSAHLGGEDDPTKWLAIPPATRLGLGDDPRLGVTGWGPQQGVYDLVTRGPLTLATLRTRCASVRVRVPGDALSDVGHGSGTGGSWGMDTSRYVAAGASLTWPDGREAGLAVEDSLVEGEVTEQGDRMCFSQLLHAIEENDGTPVRPEWSLTICAKRDAFTGAHERRRRPRP